MARQLFVKEVVSFIVPVLNEEKNIKDTIDTIENNVPYEKLDYEIIIVDGGSIDRTVEIAKSFTEDNKKIKIYSCGGVKGFGHAYKIGVSMSQGDYIILIPGDNEVAGEAIQDILNEVGTADIIIPYFVNQNIRSLFRRCISRTFVWILNMISGVKLHYYNGTVLYRSKVLKGYNIRTSGFAYQAESLINLIKAGFTYKEVATKIQQRSSGKTKIFSFSNITSVMGFLISVYCQQISGKLFKKTNYFSKTNDFRKNGLSEISVPDEINYIAVFLTFNCNLKCGYCINNYEKGILKKGNISGEQWVRGLNRLKLRHNLPVTLQGGEPTLHKDFYYIIENLKPEIEIDILTNLQFDADKFISKVHPGRINRDSKFHSIRASYHPSMMDIDETIVKVSKLQEAGFNICLSSVAHPDSKAEIAEAVEKSKRAGITFFQKDLLGFYNGQLYGSYKYPEAVMCQTKKNVRCRTDELLIDPRGIIHRCTRDVYIDANPIGYLLDPDFKVEYKYRYCPNFGYCNPCDIKLKTNRFLQKGHTAVDIDFIE
ncbi:MAG: hypothetical protein CVU78_01275 [Elusimicrobia bacterium HGW-Elusimicrobia-2]|nr:MAG: hypothetical protein CVU78_01275 [Elusimicrobia bacterium HGW-Elusimicrobia-2]